MIRAIPTFLVAIALSAMALPVFAAIDSNWANLGRPRSIAGVTFLPDGGYLAHGFDSIGNVPVNKLAKSTRYGWSTFPSRVAWSGISATALDQKGDLFVAGLCNAGGTDGAGCLGIWKGQDWQFVPLSAEGTVRRIIADGDGHLFVGGSFTSIGGVAARSVAQWDGNGWSALGTGTDTGVFQLSFAKDGKTLFAASKRIDPSSGTLNAYRWDGTWTPIANYSLRSISAAAFGPDGDLYVAGQPIQAGASPPVVARFSSGKWTTIPTPFDFQEYPKSFLVDSLGTLWAGGDFKQDARNWIWCSGATWNGTEWKKCVLPKDASIPSLDGDGKMAAAGESGAFLRTADGWIRLGPPDNFLGGEYHAMALDRSGTVYLGVDSLVFRWDGIASWRVGSGLPGRVEILAAGPEGELYAAGRIGLSGPAFLHRWNGKTWSALPDPGAQVKVMAIDRNGRLHIVSSITLKRWDDSVWTNLGSSYSGTQRTGIAFDPDGNLYKTDNASVYVRNDTGWAVPEFWKAVGDKGYRALDIGFNRFGNAYVFVEGLTGLGPDYSGFTVLEWDGKSVSKLGAFASSETVTNAYQSHAFDSRGRLHIAGMFDFIYDASGKSANIHSIARWDGAVWNPLGAGIEKPYFHYSVRKVAIDSGDYVHMYGIFQRAGGMLSSSYAVYSRNTALTRLPLPNHPKARSLSRPRVTVYRGSFRLQGMLPGDRILVHALDGTRLFEASAESASLLPLQDGQPRIVRVTRKRSVIYSGIVMP